MSRAWHFLREDRRLGYGDGVLVEAGYTYYSDQEPTLCHSGLHASVRPLDALRYAPGPIVCRVEMGGTIVHGDDKLVGTERAVLWMGDATDVLRKFARRCSPWNAAWDAAWGAWDARNAAWAAAGDAAGDAQNKRLAQLLSRGVVRDDG